jgi:hypothetical protein
MPEFNNLLEAEAYYKEEAQAKAENRKADHVSIPQQASPVHENTVFDPNPELAYDVTPDPETIKESGSPFVESEVEVVETFDPAVLTPIPHYNADGTNATVEPEVIEEPPVAEFTEDPEDPDTESSDTPEE